jgi:hypothetical protein
MATGMIAEEGTKTIWMVGIETSLEGKILKHC